MSGYTDRSYFYQNALQVTSQPTCVANGNWRGCGVAMGGEFFVVSSFDEVSYMQRKDPVNSLVNSL